MQKVTPPAPDGVDVNSSSPVEEFKRNHVVVHVRMGVEAVGQLSTVRASGLTGARSRTSGVALEIAVAEFTLADFYAARQGSAVVANSVIGNFNVVSPAVYENAATALGAVGNQQAIDPRRIALEIARERVGNVAPIAGSAPSAIGWPSGAWCRQDMRLRRQLRTNRSGGNPHAFSEHGDSSAFVRSHQSRLLQHFRKVAVYRGVPAKNAFEWDPVHLRDVGCG